MEQSDKNIETPFRDILRLDRLPRGGLSDVLVPDQRERKAAAALLDLLELPELAFEFCLTPEGARRWRLQGVLCATVVQSCVVTLDPVETVIEEHVSVKFWPIEELTRDESRNGQAELDISPDGPEPVENGILPLGQFVYESLASIIDPYPKTFGAELPEDSLAVGPASEPSGPFAALHKLIKR